MEDWELSRLDKTAIQEFLSEGKEFKKSGVRTLKKVMQRLKNKIAILQEYRDYKTGGSAQNIMAQKLRDYKGYLKSIQLTLAWQNEMRPNTKTNRWRREFYRVGTQDEAERNVVMKLIKIIRVRKKDNHFDIVKPVFDKEADVLVKKINNYFKSKGLRCYFTKIDRIYFSDGYRMKLKFHADGDNKGKEWWQWVGEVNGMNTKNLIFKNESGPTICLKKTYRPESHRGQIAGIPSDRALMTNGL